MPTENKIAEPEFDLNDADGGRDYIAHLFKTVLKRHDYRQYITERLAGDFACTLSRYFEDSKAREAALRLRLNAADQRNDELVVSEAALREELDTMTAAAKAMRNEWRVDQERLTAAEQRNAEREELLLKCMHSFNHVVGFSDQAARSAWYENFLKPVSGAVLLHLAKTTPEPPAKPTESGASE